MGQVSVFVFDPLLFILSWQYLYEEIPHPESSSPGHAPFVHWLQVLQGREGRGGSELLDRSLSWRRHDGVRGQDRTEQERTGEERTY